MGSKHYVDPKQALAAIPGKIIGRFIREIEEADERDFFDRNGDPFGVEKLHCLMAALEEIDAGQRHWDNTTDFVLGRSAAHSVGFYTLTLLCLSPHVSITKREEIVKHLSVRGDHRNVFHLTTAQLFRKPNKEEITAIAQYHNRHYSSSGNEVWKELLNLAKESGYHEEVELIIGILAELKKHEDEPDLY